MKEYNKGYESGRKRTMLLICNIMLSILLLLTSAFTITLAVMKFGLDIGGDINFQATDVQATISAGKITNGELKDASTKMQAIELTSGLQDETSLTQAKESWKGLDITFTSKKDIVLSFSITNNHPEKNLKVTLTSNSGTLDNMTMITKMAGQERNTFVIEQKTDKATSIDCEIVFHIVDNTKSADITNFSVDYKLELTDEQPDVVTPTYEIVDEEGNPDPNGKYLMFGYYPQTIKAENVSIVNENTPESNGYYKGSDGELYAKVQIAFDVAQYEQDFMLGNFSNGSKAEQDQTYYFKVERLRWRILEKQDNGQALIVCDTIIDNTPYQPNYKYENGYYYATQEDKQTILQDEKGQNVYANNYKYSNIRNFLTGEFYNNAFNEEEKALILETEVDNSLESTLNQGGQYVCENTQDKVFALSLSDVNNTKYGFKDSSNAESEIDMYDIARNFKTTDFSKAKGSATITEELLTQMGADLPPEMVELMKQHSVGVGAGWHRSPSDINLGFLAFSVEYGVYGNSYVYSDYNGVVPALQIQL